MIRSYLLLAFRRIKTDKITSAINVFGLGLALTLGLFTLLYIQYETNYERWIPDHENIYRVYRPYNEGRNGQLITPGPVASVLNEEVPGVRSASRAMPNSEILLSWKETHFVIKNGCRVDSTFFNTISLDFKHGDPREASKKVNLVVLSERTSLNIFGDQDPIGESVLIENSQWFEVVGVLGPAKGPSHLDADLFIIDEIGQTSWTGARGYTYVKLADGAIPEHITNTLYDIANREIRKEYARLGETIKPNSIPRWELQPLADAHLLSGHLGETGHLHGSWWKISIIVMIGFFVMLLAIINYINLTTAGISIRGKEIGIRNISGAGRSQLIGQFLTEAMVYSFLALILALIIAPYLLPYFNSATSRTLSLFQLFEVNNVGILLTTTLVVSFLAGLLPAFYWSSIRPVKVLKSRWFESGKAGSSRAGLIVCQFTLSLGLSLFVVFVWSQIQFVTEKDLGFNGHQIAVFRINEQTTMEEFQQKKFQIAQLPGVVNVSQTSGTPGRFIPNYQFRIEGIDNLWNINTIFADADWVNTFNLPVKQGRSFNSAYGLDEGNNFLVNESFVDRFEIQNPIGRRMKFPSDTTMGTIVGVIQDFHYQGLENEIEPLAICNRMDKAWMGSFAVCFNTSDITHTLNSVIEWWKSIEPAFPVDYQFIDEQFASLYDNHILFRRKLTYASILCLVIALSGLFGLTLFIIQRKTKEIGIRKVLGASVGNLFINISTDFIKYIIISGLIASPIVWLLVRNWLANFAYRISIHWWVFVVTLLATILLSIITVGFHVFKAALANPVNSIRTE